MEKQKLNKFISKYSLGGLIESVKWELNNNILSTSFISDNKSVLGTVSMSGFEYEDKTFGLYDTSKMIKILSVMEEGINFNVKDINGKPLSLQLKDEVTNARVVLSDISVIPTVPDLKELPKFDIKIKLDDVFIDRFIKSKSALADEDNFTFRVKNGVSEIIIGYSNINSNRIALIVSSDQTKDVKPITFSATYLKEILVANRESSDAILNISTKGLAHISFESDEYKSDYYLVQIKN